MVSVFQWRFVPWVLYYCFILVHRQLLLYTLLSLKFIYMWFLFRYTFIFKYLFWGYRDLGVFYKSMTSSSGCCLLLLSSVFFSPAFWDWYLLHLLLDAIRFLGFFFISSSLFQKYTTCIVWSWLILGFLFYLFFLVVGLVIFCTCLLYTSRCV